MINKIANISENFTKPCIFQWLDKDIEVIRSAPIKALEAMCTANNSSDIRVYVNGTHQTEYEKKVISLPHDFNTSWDKWIQQINDNGEVLVVLNCVEHWYEPIARWCAGLFSNVNPILGNQLLHLEVTFFIGNNRYTPFGVHVDETSDAIHFNLGPNDRAMYTWDKDTFIKHTGSQQAMHEPEKILHLGERNDIKAGTGFFLPASRYYHIGMNNGYSISLAIALIRYDYNSLLEKALRLKISEYVQQISKETNFINQLLDNLSHKRGVISSSSLPYYDKYSYTDALTEYILRIRSNGGFRVPPSSPINIPNNWMDGYIRLVSPFRLFVLKDTKRVRIFVRGTMISCRKSDWLLDLVDQINSGKLLSIISLIRYYRGQADSKTVSYFLQYFLNHRAIEVVNL